MRAGIMRHRVTIQMPVETQNDYGEPEVRWQTVHSGVWAFIGPLKGREFFASKQLTAEISARICIRYLSGVTAKMKIVHGPTCPCKVSEAQDYLIEEIINDEERYRSLSFMCSRFVQ
jgi:SPP1 family predicted phage head-tail adaptor